jgi:8-oxo-dGTP diphosphatase
LSGTGRPWKVAVSRVPQATAPSPRLRWERLSVTSLRVGSAVVVRDSADRLLLGRRAKEPNRGRWVLPGGKIEAFETIDQAGVREVLEETGLTVEVTGRIGVFEIIEPPSEHRVIIYSWARPVDPAVPVAGDDLSEVRFFTRDELAGVDLTEICTDVLEVVGYVVPDNQSGRQYASA